MYQIDLKFVAQGIRQTPRATLALASCVTNSGLTVLSHLDFLPQVTPSCGTYRRTTLDATAVLTWPVRFLSFGR